MGTLQCWPRHWQTGEVLSQDMYHDVPDRRHHFARMHRASLQKALLKHVPPDSIHLGQKVLDVNASSSTGVVVDFADGTIIHVDILIGADGINSVWVFQDTSCMSLTQLQSIRKSFVPEHELVWAGDVVIRSAFDYSLVEDIGDILQNSAHFVRSSPQSCHP